MASTRDVTRTEQRIAEVDALQQTIEQLRGDLQAYGEALRQELAWLEDQQANSGAAARPEPPAASPKRQPAPSRQPPAPEPEPAEPAEDDFVDLDEIQPAPAAEQQRPKASPFELDDPDENKAGGKPVSVLISDGTISEEPLSGWVIERPAGGLKILCDDELHVGTVIGVRPNRAHPDAQWINVSVKNVRPERNSFVVTCQFVERPPWNALALFN